MDSRTCHIDTIQPSLQKHFKHITRPSNDSHAKPSCIPILQNKKSHLDDTSGYESTDTELSATEPPKAHNAMHARPSTRNSQPPAQKTKPAVIPANTQTTAKQPTLPAPRTLTASAHSQCTRKTPLLPTPPASVRQCNYRNHYKQHIPGPSPPRYNIYSTFSGPATLNNHRCHLQPHIPGTTYYKPTIPAPRILHKTTPTDTRTLHTASISTTICSCCNINTKQPNQQSISTSNQPLSQNQC